MAKRTITHFQVGNKLFNDIVQVLMNLPAHTSRELLNRIENKAECEPVFKVELGGKKKKATRKKAKRKVRKPAVGRKKVAKRKGRS